MRKRITEPLKPAKLDKQILVTINTLDDRHCNAACLGFYFDMSKGEHRCGMFQVKLKTAYVKPGHPIYDNFVRCAKCRKAEVAHV